MPAVQVNLTDDELNAIAHVVAFHPSVPKSTDGLEIATAWANHAFLEVGLNAVNAKVAKYIDEYHAALAAATDIAPYKNAVTKRLEGEAEIAAVDKQVKDAADEKAIADAAALQATIDAAVNAALIAAGVITKP